MHARCRTSVALVAVLAPACSVLVGPDAVQCSTTADCAARGGSFAQTTCERGRCVAGGALRDAAAEGGDGGDPWTCLGKVTSPGTDASHLVQLGFVFTALTMAGRPGLTATLCYALDPTCTPSPFPVQTSDSTGKVTWQVPYGAVVFANVQGDSTIVPTLVYVDPPPTAAQNTVSVNILDQTEMQGFAQLSTQPINPADGVILAVSSGCYTTYGIRMPGVAYSLLKPASDTFQFYLVNALPDVSATVTSSNGVGGFVNVPPGPATVVATLPARSNAKIGESAVVVKGGWITYAGVSAYDN